MLISSAIGKVKAIGVSNWSIPYLEDLSKTWKIVPAVDQVELHPYVNNLSSFVLSDSKLTFLASS